MLAMPSLMPPSRRSRDVLELRIRAVLAAGPKANPYLQMAFQPVVDLRTGRIAGAEALARFKSPDGEPYRTPDLWFDDARRCGLSTQLELLAIAAALGRLDEMPPGTYLAVNASPETLVSRELRELLARVPGERVVVELTEHARVDDYDGLLAATTWFRARGMRLAVDDAGAGFASFQHILRLQPDIIKLDRSLTNGVDANPVRFALASAMVTFAASLGAKICAEGIETSAELAALQQLGIANGQGYFLGKPGPLPLPAPPDCFATLGVTLPAVRASVRRDSTRLVPARAKGLVNHDPEEDFDRFTRLAARVLDAPVAVLSFAEDSRQFVKSMAGPRAVCENARAICAATAEARSPLVIDDARLHPLAKDHPELAAHGIAAYAGVPIAMEDGEPIGVLCVIDTSPREWSMDDIATLRDLAQLVAARIHMRLVMRELGDRAALVDALFAQTELPIIVYNVEGRLERASAAACARLGRVEEDLRGVRSADLVHPDDMLRIVDARERLLAGHVDRLELPQLRYLGPEGPMPSHGVSTLVRDRSGAARFFVVTLS